MVVAVFLHAHHLAASPREQLQGDAARTGKEVEGGGSVKVQVAVEHVEDVLLGKVGRRTGLERAGNVKMAPLEFSRDNSHNYELCTMNYAL